MPSVELKSIDVVEVLGYSFPATIRTSADGGLIKSISVPAAKTGTLTTRTNDSSGTLTMAASHGITTGARLDLYWADGSRRGITVGTVAGNSVPISVGAGDNLPVQDTAITAMVPVEEEFLFTGNGCKALAFFSQRRGTIVVAEADDGAATHRVLTAGVSSVWTPDRDSVNPVADADVAKVFFSHADATQASNMRIAALFD